MGRPRKYATAAERQKAYRERKDRMTLSGQTVPMRTIQILITDKDHETLHRLAEIRGGQSVNELMFDLVGWALANRKWENAEPFRRLPRAPNPDEDYVDIYSVQILSGVRTDGWRTVRKFDLEEDAMRYARRWAKSHPMDSVRVLRGDE